MEKEHESFQYTYSAKQQEEIRNIRQKYMPQEENKMEQLRRMDAGVTRKATSISLAIGIGGTLLLGIGMCRCMVWQGVWFLPGIVIGLTGIGILALAYPMYHRIIKKERKKIAPEILRLTEELMKN